MDKKEFKDYWGIREDDGDDELMPADILSSEEGTDAKVYVEFVKQWISKEQ